MSEVFTRDPANLSYLITIWDRQPVNFLGKLYWYLSLFNLILFWETYEHSKACELK